VTGLPAVYVDVPLEAWLSIFDKRTPSGYQDIGTQAGEDAPVTFVDNFRGFFTLWGTNTPAGPIARDYAELSRIHPGRVDLEGWMRRTGYDGGRRQVLKNVADAKTRPFSNGSLAVTVARNAFKYLRGGLAEAGVDGIHAGLVKIIPKHHMRVVAV
jgi:hypothetical protein